jgi:hypothetical protein
VQDFLSDYRINQKKSFKRAKRSVNHLNDMFEGLRVVDITTTSYQSIYRKALKLDMQAM